METMHAAGRRNLPPVPRTSAETIPPAPQAAPAPVAAPAVPDATARLDAGQAFVTRLRAAAAAFADAAGAESAVVREVVPPARHRRARCRVVFRSPDGAESDLTFVGERRRAGAPAIEELDGGIIRWLADGQQRDPAWLMADEESTDGLAIDLTAWLAAG
ncbi:hypothetical protein SAMN04515665_10735 [Blastococcus sp. DSM 46786]|uniref:hypothetical protein n=1 Tax=Blastococcus sp. DSM 46786 TaxID=1798227 RepID=UPI0008B8BE88|nr:hypothetical protein [Blastococcus sp. DSM 46786]SEK98609.1 hypothetical protein SAMN04515665_10735 [Blastococcus sp. DSM 46786]